MKSREMRTRANRVFAFSICLAAAFLLLGPISAAYAQSTKTTYQVYQPGSVLLAITGKSGLFSFAGHNHGIIATQWSASLSLDPDDLRNSRATIVIPVSSLVIDSDEARQKAALGSGPSAQDVRKIQQQMLSPEVLEPERYPEIRFTTTGVEKISGDQLRVTGTLEMHGHSRKLTVPVRFKKYETGGLGFSGEFTIRQTDFGLTPQSVAGGTVKVKDQVTIQFQISATPGSRIGQSDNATKSAQPAR